ncbi:MAG: type II secretion system protein N [Rudaea sp.]|uniref:type II secretion system protein N n=1 Tax=Rudaea sp. TaxID=2136325 RepID=UPI0039E54AA2
MRRFLALLLILVAIAAVGLYFLPASIGYRYLMKPSNTVTLSDLSGTIWNGHAGSIAVHDRPIGQLDWHLRWQPLLQGRRVADFAISDSALKVQGTLNRSPSGNTFDNLTFSLPASAAAQMLHLAAKADGTVEGSAASLTLIDGWPTQLRDGKAHWSNAKLADTVLGSVDAQFDTATDGNVAGTIKSNGGAAQFAGSLKLTPQRELTLDNLDYKLPAQIAAIALDLKDATLAGSLQGKLAHIVLRSGAAPVQARGNLHWADAATATIAHETLGDIDVAFAPAADGATAGTLKNSGGSGQFDGRFKLGAERNLELDDLTFKLPASVGAALLRLDNASVAGDLDGKLAHIVLRGGSTPADARGSLHWSNAATDILSHDLLGDIDIGFAAAADGALAGTLKNESGRAAFASSWKLGADHTLELDNATLKFPGSLLAPLMHLPGLDVGGDVEGHFPQLVLRDGLWPAKVAGKLVWRGIVVSGVRQANLGDMEWELGTDKDGGIIGLVNDLGGPVQIQGTFKTSRTAYDAEAKLAARGGDAMIRKALGKVGAPQPDGSTIVQASGAFGSK